MAFGRFGIVCALAAAAALAGCGGRSAGPSALPPGASGGPTSATERAAPLEQTVAARHAQVSGTGDYGVIDGVWYTPDPVPGRPGYYAIGDEEVAGPPDDSSVSSAVVQPAPQAIVPPGAAPNVPAPAPAATRNCSTFVGNVPPPCTATGPFRRVYSAPQNSFALAHLTLPAAIPTMPTGAKPLHGDTGYIYFEGWTDSNPNAGNSEFGFQYSATHNYYTPYYRTNNPVAYKILGSAPKVPIHYMPSTPITFGLAGEIIGAQDYLHVAVIGTTVGTCVVAGSATPTHRCLGHTHTPDAGWTPSKCCILARMTTIGQTEPGRFYDGVSFGPITWSGVELAATAPTPAPKSTILPLDSKEPPWVSAGTQNWPPELNRIVTSGVTNTGETDTVDLPKLPSLSLALTPSGCVLVKNSGNVNFNVKVVGDPGKLQLSYSWIDYNSDTRFINETLVVPGGKPVPADPFELLGPSTSATLEIKGPGPNKPGNWDTGVFAYLWFRDATGTVNYSWDGGVVDEHQDVFFGSNPRCPKT